MSKEYFAAANNVWHYLGIDADPPSGKIHVLIGVGGQSVIGTKHTYGMIAWAPLMLRDAEKEEIQIKYKDDPEGMKIAAAVLQAVRTMDLPSVCDTKEQVCVINFRRT